MERVGGDETLRVNVRIIAATNRHLEERCGWAISARISIIA
jgi:transcriptional regulator with GAF, ATPase, and Fis domain